MDGNAIKNFHILANSLSVLRNYSDGSTKLFLDLQLIKLLGTSAKVFSMRILERKINRDVFRDSPK